MVEREQTPNLNGRFQSAGSTWTVAWRVSRARNSCGASCRRLLPRRPRDRPARCASRRRLGAPPPAVQPL